MLDKEIRQKSTKRVGSIVVCSAFCPGSPKRDPLDSEKMACLQNVYTRPQFYSFACIHVNRREVVNPPMTAWIKISQNVDILAKVYLVHLKVKHCQVHLSTIFDW